MQRINCSAPPNWIQTSSCLKDYNIWAEFAIFETLCWLRLYGVLDSVCILFLFFSILIVHLSWILFDCVFCLTNAFRVYLHSVTAWILRNSLLKWSVISETLNDCNRTRTHNHLVHKRILNHLVCTTHLSQLGQFD